MTATPRIFGPRTAMLNVRSADDRGRTLIDDMSGEVMLILHMTKANAKK